MKELYDKIINSDIQSNRIKECVINRDENSIVFEYKFEQGKDYDILSLKFGKIDDIYVNSVHHISNRGFGETEVPTNLDSFESPNIEEIVKEGLEKFDHFLKTSF